MPPFAVVFCAAGAVLATLVANPALGVAARLQFVGVLALLTIAVALRRSCATPQFRALFALALVAAASNAALRVYASQAPFELRTTRYTGTIVDSASADASASPSGTSRSSRLTVALDNGAVALATVRDPAPPIGAAVVVRGRLASFDEPRNPGEPSEAQLQRERGIDARLEGASVLRWWPATSWNARAFVARAHAWAHERLRDGLGEPQASVVAGELWGERAALPPQLRDEFQETGTVHVLVTAGLHLGAVAAVALWLCSLAGLPRWCACALATAIAWAFVWWSGGQLPAERAATMATMAFAARACGRATFSWNALAIAALLIAFLRPDSVASASFALSFSCVGAIFACAGAIDRGLERIVALPAPAREALTLSIATQAGTWPLGAAVFLQFSTYALAANLAIVPSVAVTMALGVAQLLTVWCAPLSTAFANLNAWLLAWVLGVVTTLSSFPFAAIPMTPAPGWCIALYDTALLAAVPLWTRGARAVSVAALAVAIGLVLWPPRAPDWPVRVTVLDVGQADAIVVRTPGGHAFLVDAGGMLERGPQNGDSLAERVGERTVVPYLLRQGIHELDALILSHPHGDHAGGCRPVLDKIRVGAIGDGGQTYGGHAYLDCIATARSRGIPILYPRAGSVWRTPDGVILHFLGPSLPFIANSRNDVNENSIAFVLRYKRFCMLFTGDAGAAAEQRFLGEDADLKCGVLKVGHHGSAYSSTPAFIAAVRPRAAIISVGRHNLFVHPSPSTLQTLQRFDARIYRTDDDAAVSIVSDGSNTTVTPLSSSDGGH